MIWEELLGEPCERGRPPYPASLGLDSPLQVQCMSPTAAAVAIFSIPYLPSLLSPTPGDDAAPDGARPEAEWPSGSLGFRIRISPGCSSRGSG